MKICFWRTASKKVFYSAMPKFSSIAMNQVYKQAKTSSKAFQVLKPSIATRLEDLPLSYFDLSSRFKNKELSTKAV
jgi:hypothetical protein